MNPFTELDIADDVEEQNFTSNHKPKKSHQERRQVMEAKIRQAEETVQKQTSTPTLNQDIPERVRDDPRKKKYYEMIPPKEVPVGHYLDRKSGTGRIDRPRKEGGGHGGIGNLHDEVNQQKYLGSEQQKQDLQATVQESEQVQGITLDEYYRNKGVEIVEIGVFKKESVKKGEVNAEWIKKEKLTVMQTKEDKKAEDGTEKAGKKRREYNNKIGLDENLNSEMFGFGAQPRKVEREQRAPQDRDNNRGEGKGGQKGQKGAQKGEQKKRQEKVTLNVEDFPSL